jgi:hypothetical protein
MPVLAKARASHSAPFIEAASAILFPPNQNTSIGFAGPV